MSSMRGNRLDCRWDFSSMLARRCCCQTAVICICIVYILQAYTNTPTDIYSLCFIYNLQTYTNMFTDIYTLFIFIYNLQNIYICMLQHLAQHCKALHAIALHCLTVHDATLHYITRHGITYIHSCIHTYMSTIFIVI